MQINKIQVIDAPCGYGKTSWAIQTMNDTPDNSYIYCTPFLDEIDRVRAVCGNYNRFAEPLPYTGSKINNFNELLATGCDIAVTHTTFLNATPETLDLIRAGNYTLIIDEALDVVTPFNEIQTVESASRQSVTKADIAFLLERGIISISNNNRVVWNGSDYGNEFKFSEVRRLANLNRLYCIDNIFLIAVFPPEIFECFNSIFILTYMFGGSIFKYYLDFFGLAYNRRIVMRTGDAYNLSDYDNSVDREFRKRCKELIHICDSKNLNDYEGQALSKGWFESSKKDDRLKHLKNNLNTYFRRYLKPNRAKASNGDIMWTCYGDYKAKLKGAGYSTERRLSKEERQLSTARRKDIEKKLSCFVPCNAKATNIYRKRWALAYCVNMFFHPMIRKFFTDGNASRECTGMMGIHPDEELYALSCMIQWIFRSRIRDGKPIEIYIPSNRMRGLLIDWMECKL